MTNCCCNHKRKIDYLFWSTLSISALAYFLYLFNPPILSYTPALHNFCHSVYEFINKMWWGLLLGIFFVGLLGIIPKEVVIHLLGREKTLKA